MGIFETNFALSLQAEELDAVCGGLGSDFSLRTDSDQHVFVNGRAAADLTHSDLIFEEFQNTAGGPTFVSTTVSNSADYTHQVTSEATISTPTWGVHVMADVAGIHNLTGVILQDASGSRVLLDGQTIIESDGTAITATSAGVTLHEGVYGGDGFVTTNILSNFAGGLDVSSTGHNVIAGGTTGPDIARGA